MAPAAHALNAALSDAAQIAGPPLVAAITLLASPRLALAGFACGVVAAAFVLARRLPPADGSAPAIRGRAMGLLRASAGLRLLAAVDVLTAGWLAALELAEAFTWLTTASGLGIATGSFTSGRLAPGNGSGPIASLVLAAGLALGALVVAVAGRRAL